MKDLPRPKKTKVKKIKLSDLMGGEGKANADLYKGGDEPEKRKYHLINRSIRDNLITPKGAEYERRLSGDAAKDIKYHEVAREFVNNGFSQTKAYAAVFGVPLSQAKTPASRVFNSTWMRALVNGMMMGTGGELAELPKAYLIEKLTQMIDSNVLDYIDDDGGFLTVRELKALPTWTQQIIKKLHIHSWSLPNMIKNDVGAMEQYGEIRHQKVQIELYDRLKALETLARAMQWIANNADAGTTIYIGADTMVAANQRVEKLRRRSSDIEGTAKRIAAN